LGRFGHFGSKGPIFSHWASVSSRPYRAIDPPLALLHEFISHFRQVKNHQFNLLYPVLKQALVIFASPAEPAGFSSRRKFRKTRFLPVAVKQYNPES
jgi:hypothetical protein